MQIVLTSPRRGRLRIVGKRGDTVAFRETFSPDSKREQDRIAQLSGLTVQEILSAAIRFDENRDADPVVVELPEAGQGDFSCVLRSMAGGPSQPFVSASPIEALDAAIAASPTVTEAVIEWADIERLAVLDIDYHGRESPGEYMLKLMRLRVAPAPSRFWITKGGGVHLIYHSAAGFAANELAATAGLAWIGIDPTATFEVIARTRVPPGAWYSGQQTTEQAALAAWLRNTVTEDQIADYLDSVGKTPKEAYPHDQCPLMPAVESHGTPVYVGDGGIFCHKCESLGVTFGSRRAGYFPYTALLHGGAPSLVKSMGEHFTHYEHAKLVLSDKYGVRGNIAELAYRSLLKMIHGADDPRVERAFYAGNNLIRLDNRWATRDCLATYDKNIQPILAALPACMNPQGAANAETVSRFTQNIDLSEYGYPAVTPIRGLRIYSQRLPFSDEDRISVVVPSGILRAASMERYRPRYIPKEKRIPDPWAIIEQSLPSVNREYVKLLIAAKGVAEGQVGLPPNILVCGPTASGKSTMATLAAAICGDHNTEVPWQKSVERFRQGVAAGADAGTFVTVNEILKDAERNGSTAIQALDVFLNLTPDSVSHKLYIGPVPLGRVPVCIVTDITVPQLLRNDVQLARRFVYVRLRDSHPEWVSSLTESGLFQVRAIRTITEQHAVACDAIVSEVIDEFFDRPRTLAEIAKSLGFSLLMESPDFDDPTEELRRLYSLVNEAPPLPEKYRNRWAGDDWKLIALGDETPLAEAWEAVNDGSDGERYFNSRRCSECDWKRLLHSEHEIRFETRRHRGIMVLRFKTRVTTNGANSDTGYV